MLNRLYNALGSARLPKRIQYDNTTVPVATPTEMQDIEMSHDENNSSNEEKGISVSS